MEDNGFSIKIAALKTGLTQHVIRAWERRYGAVSPERKPSNRRRLYSTAEIERLRLLSRLTRAGYGIGEVAGMPDENLIKLLEERKTASSSILESPNRQQSAGGGTRLDACISAAETFDAEALESLLMQAKLRLARTALIENVIAPIMQRIGDMCREGTLRIAHEHLATAVVRNFLGNLRSEMRIEKNAPNVVVATPAGQAHDIGAAIAAAVASGEGWRATYLGANLPAEEIANAALSTGARAIALSIVYPEDDIKLPDELRRLRLYCGRDLPIFVGGRGRGSYINPLEEINAVVVEDIDMFKLGLENLRKRINPVL